MSKPEQKSDLSPAPAPTVQITGADFLDAIKALRPPDTSGISPERRESVYAPQGQRRWRMIPCVSPWTRATFTAKVLESKVHPDGRVVELHDYRHPQDIYKTESNGGTTPDGMSIFRQDGLVWTDTSKEPPKQALTPEFLQRRYEEFFKRDLRMIVGDGRKTEGGMKSVYCVDPSTGMKTPWRLGADEAAA